MDVLRVLGLLGIGAILAAVVSTVGNWHSTNTKKDTDDKNLALEAINAAIPGLEGIIRQMQSHITWLSNENEKCLKVSADQALEIAGLKLRVRELERKYESAPTN